MYKAIIIDNEHNIVKGLSCLINWKDIGYVLSGVAFDAESAITLIKSISPNVVVSDVQLGDATGLDIMEKVKISNPNTLFIFISGFSVFSYCQRAISQGAIDYLLKPIDFEYLESVLIKCKDISKERKILDDSDKILYTEENHIQINSSSEGKEGLIYEIKEYIENNYNDNISMQSIGKQFFISQTYFSELFKKEFGINFKKYLTAIRMEKAKLYILHSSYKISDVGAKVGFDDPGYFSQVFKQYNGFTPREFKSKFTCDGVLS